MNQSNGPLDSGRQSYRVQKENREFCVFHTITQLLFVNTRHGEFGIHDVVGLSRDLKFFTCTFILNSCATFNSLLHTDRLADMSETVQ